MKNADHSNSVLQIKLLIVEDEKGLSVAVCDSLKSLGFQIDAAYTQEEALTCLLENDYGLIVLDLNLPDGSGLELLKWIRKEQNQTAVIILSARNSLDDKIAGLDLGADDYLTKPFHMAELNSRINAVIRRKFNLVEDKLIFKEIELNLSAREIRIKGKKIEFRNKEFDLLKFMIINKNQVISKRTIANHIWQDSQHMDEDFSLIYVNMNTLRAKLKKNGVGDYLKTVYGMGYKLTHE